MLSSKFSNAFSFGAGFVSVISNLNNNLMRVILQILFVKGKDLLWTDSRMNTDFQTPIFIADIHLINYRKAVFKKLQWLSF